MKFQFFTIPFLFVLFSSFSLAQNQTCDPKKWEETIQEFEKMDQTDPPSKNGILFIGSSSIRGWDLDTYFEDYETINRGFGGSHMEDCLYYTNRIVIPYQPKIIVVYEGDNDIAFGKNPKTVLKHYKSFVHKVHAELPDTEIVYIAIKPSLKRWLLVEKMREANRLIEEYTHQDPLLHFADIDTPMIGADGMPRRDIFKDDGLHLNAKGYTLWSNVLLPFLTD